MKSRRIFHVEFRWRIDGKSTKMCPLGEDINKVEIAVKKNKILDETARKYKICKRVYKSLHKSVADNFFEYLSTLPYYEINKIS